MVDLRLVSRSALISSALVLLLFATGASALTVYAPVLGPSYHYTSIQESSSYGDPEPLFDQPVLGAGNQLDFNPTTFSAFASGAGGLDNTGSQLQLQISSASPADIIETIILTEGGFVDLTGAGTALTRGELSMAGFITVLNTTTGPPFPIIPIPFSGTFAPASVYELPGDVGMTTWTATAVIDVAALFPGATQVQVSWDNDLFAASEDGTTSEVVKTFARINTIPEPGTGLFVGTGLALLGLRVRNRIRSTREGEG